MKAWRVHELGEPADVLQLEDVELPVPGVGELRVRVLGAAANFPDVLMCRGMYQVRPELPFTAGFELCGEVDEVGGDVDGFVPGDRIVGLAKIPHGAFAEYAVVNAVDTFSAPASLDDAQASALVVAYQTGWFGLHRRAHLQPGEVLLVHAAAGGVGSAAVQLGKAAGATVIAVVGGPVKARVAAELGADVVVDRTTDDFVAVVKEVTAGRGANVVYDPVGGDTYTRSAKCIAFEGRIILVGFAGGEIQTTALNHALVKNYSIVGLHWGLYAQFDRAAMRACHDELLSMAASGVISPLIGDRMPLAGVPEGLTQLAAGTTVGRVAFLP